MAHEPPLLRKDMLEEIDKLKQYWDGYCKLEESLPKAKSKKEVNEIVEKMEIQLGCMGISARVITLEIDKKYDRQLKDKRRRIQRMNIPDE